MSSDEKNSRYRERYKARKLAGLCVKCGKSPPRKNNVRCETCLGKHNFSSRKSYNKNLSTGLCANCGGTKEDSRSSCNDCLKKKQDEHLRRKLKCFEHYGNACKCCGEAIEEFLTIDHINGGGNNHRREIGGHSGKNPHANSKIYAFLIRNGFPSGFQTLCFSCNRGKWMNKGTCPHMDPLAIHLIDFLPGH